MLSPYAARAFENAFEISQRKYCLVNSYLDCVDTFSRTTDCIETLFKRTPIAPISCPTGGASRFSASTSTVSRDESRRSLERRSATQARCDVARGLVRSEIDLPRARGAACVPCAPRTARRAPTIGSPASIASQSSCLPLYFAFHCVRGHACKPAW